MAKHVLREDSYTRWDVDTVDEKWILDEDAKITVSGLDAIIVQPLATNSDVFVYGDISVTSVALGGVSMLGSNVDITIGEKSVINAMQAFYGVYSQSANGDIYNNGIIKSLSLGIQVTGSTDVHNTGNISAGRGIWNSVGGTLTENSGRIEGTDQGILSAAADTEIVNEAHGRIIGIESGIELTDDGDAKITNHGLIRGGNAVIDMGGALELINRGRIVGNVVLGGGDDMLDTRRGSIDGFAIGGDGDDNYYVSKQIDILELLGQGFDTVHSSGSFTLAGDIERLLLTGKKNIDGDGSTAGDEIFGNAGNNSINGHDGNDRLSGGAGQDALTGGADSDIFRFLLNFGADRITDFENGVDLLFIDGIFSQQDFEALDIEEKNSNVIIDMSDAGRIIIEDMLLADLSYAEDFALPI